MLFNTIDYLFFMIFVALVYYLLPQKVKMAWLAVVSMVFYALFDIKYVFIVSGVIIITYIGARLIEYLKKQGKNRISKAVLIIVAILEICNLAVFKYLDFIFGNINKLISYAGFGEGISVLQIALSVGISFYTFQSLGYVIDVYRGKYEAEKNIIIYTLFVAFFPQICCGPIGRGDKLLPQYRKKIVFDVDMIREGMLTIAYGIFLKLVIADNLNAFIAPKLSSYSSQNGMTIMLAVMLIGIRIYCDFYGYSLMARGSGKILQIELMKNFEQPYLSCSFKEFWRGWHVSLTSWFTEYIYIPLGGNRKGKVRKYINQTLVFALSGLWHGSAWHYIAWGILNGIYLMLEDIFGPVLATMWDKLGVDRTRKAWMAVKWMFIYFMIGLSMLLFEADSLRSSFEMLGMMVRDFRPGWVFMEACFRSFDSTWQFGVLFISIIIMTLVDIYEKKGTSVINLIFRQQVVIRWCIYLVLLFTILCWGAFGDGFSQTKFIYFEF